jgi:chemosensory pili system protein ChpA (sensor histidine kinase/response regulator)
MSEMLYQKPKNTILIVDDDPAMRKMETKFLERAGFNVVTAEDGLEALNKAQKQEFDVILCDITMPKMTGDQAIKHIRAGQFNKDTPIIVLSGYLDKEVVGRIKGSVSKAFTKPVDLQVVVQFIQNILDKKKNAS